MKTKKDTKRIITERTALIQMYQSGFFDGFNENTKHELKLSLLLKRCAKAFKIRFEKGVKDKNG